jgi:hypothetical protein
MLAGNYVGVHYLRDAKIGAQWPKMNEFLVMILYKSHGAMI